MKATIIIALVLSTMLLQSVTTTPGIVNPRIVVLDEPVLQPLGPCRVLAPNYVHVESDTPYNLSVICGPLVYRFDWLAADGQEYEVESSTDLQTWTKTGVIIIGRGVGESWFEPADGSKFFRVVTK